MLHPKMSKQAVIFDLFGTLVDEMDSWLPNIRIAMTQRVLTPRPDAEDTLRRLRDSGFKIGLISDCTPEIPALFWSTPLAPYIHSGVFSPIDGLTKPSPRIFKMACEALGVPPERCWYVGDGGSHELTGAKSFGMEAVLVAMRYVGDGGVFRAINWDGPRIERLRQVLELV